MNLPKKNCTGCAACYSICNKHAIELKCDLEGFYKPDVNFEKCIICNLCEKVCPIINENSVRLFYEPTKLAYAVKSKQKKIQLKCTSGGFFTTLAQQWIAEGGIVYGAAYDEKYTVRHIRVDDKEDVYRLSESKYVQSQIGECFLHIEKDLQSGKKVLFSGTACQVAGIRACLGKEYENLLCIDVICHGVPSPKVWEWYINMLQQECEDKIIYVRHRGKSTGGWCWQKQFFEVTYGSGDIRQENIWENSYMKGFLKDMYVNQACHTCIFKNDKFKRVSDMTMADFWGCEKEEQEFFDADGVNLVLVNTDKGEKNWKKYKEIFCSQETDVERAMLYNAAAIRPYRKPFARRYFFRCFREVQTLKQYDSLVARCEKILKVENPIALLSMRVGNKIVALLTKVGSKK